MGENEQEQAKHDPPQGHPFPPVEPTEEKTRSSKSEKTKRKQKPTGEHEEIARMLGKMIVEYHNATSPQKAVRALEIEPDSRFPYHIVKQHNRHLNDLELQEFRESRKRLDHAITYLCNEGDPRNSPAFGYFTKHYNHAFNRRMQKAEGGSLEEVEVYAFRYIKPPRTPENENVPSFIEALSYCVYKFFSLKESAGLLGRCHNEHRRKISKDKYEPCEKFYLGHRRSRKKYCSDPCREKQNRIGKRLEAKKRKALRKKGPIK